MAATLVFAASAIGSTMVAVQNNNNNTNGNVDSLPVVYEKNMKYRDYKDGVFKVRAGAGSRIAPRPSSTHTRQK
jgi:hypothetical protein